MKYRSCILPLLMPLLLAGCASHEYFPDPVVPLIEGGEIHHYVYSLDGSWLTLKEYKSETPWIVRVQEGPSIGVDLGLGAIPGGRASSDMVMQLQGDSEEYSLMVSAQYPEDFLPRDPLTKRATGDIAILLEDRSIGLVSYDPNRFRYQYWGYWENWKFKIESINPMTMGWELVDDQGIVAMLTIHNHLGTVQFRPGTTEEERARILSVSLLSRTLVHYVHMNMPDRASAYGEWPRRFIWFHPGYPRP